jgi:gluconate 2-dehydrogenase gamma chain
MNSKTHSQNAAQDSAALLTRREAIRRTAALLGIALTPAWLDGIASAAQPAAPNGGGAKHLSATQFAMVSAIAERIIPRTDTPGAKDVGVPLFIDLMLGQYSNDAERGTIFGGLADLDARSERVHRRGFVQLAAAQQDALLKAVAEESQGKEKTFFHLMKDLTVIGYFTSEEVGKKVTVFDPIPGRWEACIPVTQTGNRSWTR